MNINNFFKVSLTPGNWKWWFSVVVYIASMVLLLLGTQNWVFISIAIPILLSLKVSNLEQGLITKNFKKTLFIAFLGFLVFTILVYFFEKSGKEAAESGKKVIDSMGFGESNARDWKLFMLICFWAPLSEELFFRGAIFKPIWNSLAKAKKLGKNKKSIAFIIASAISSFLFISAHGGEGQDNQMIMLFILGIIASATYYITGSIYAPVLFHSLNNSFVIFNADINYTDANLKYYTLLMPIAVLLALFSIQKILHVLEKVNLKTVKKEQ